MRVAKKFSRTLYSHRSGTPRQFSTRPLRAGMTDMAHFRRSPNSIGRCFSPQFGRLLLRAWVWSLCTQVKHTQAGNGRCPTCTGRAHLCQKTGTRSVALVKWSQNSISVRAGFAEIRPVIDPVCSDVARFATGNSRLWRATSEKSWLSWPRRVRPDENAGATTSFRCRYPANVAVSPAICRRADTWVCPACSDGKHKGQDTKDRLYSLCRASRTALNPIGGRDSQQGDQNVASSTNVSSRVFRTLAGLSGALA